MKIPQKDQFEIESEWHKVNTLARQEVKDLS